MLAALTADHLKAWHRERYAPQTSVLTIAGDISEANAESRVREALGAWPKSGYSEQLPPMPAPPPRRALVLDRLPSLLAAR